MGKESKSTPLITVVEIIAELRPLVRSGMRHAALRDCHQMLSLHVVAERAKGSTERDVLALALESVLRQAVRALGDGPSGYACQLLLGTVGGTRGLRLMERRRLAADSLFVSPDTFRRSYENDLVADTAAEILRIELHCLGTDLPASV
jgi:hypothetical protein